jgi:serine/threonine-protein kinase
VLSALASAHARGIVHRDLKPENVFLLLGGAAPAVKLLDFGVAKFHGLDDPFTTPTLEGAQLGTPAYMAPEQWMGRRDVDHRADVFAVGVMLYEMLTGALPFEGKGRGQLFLQIVEGTSPPEAPSAADEAVPAALDPVVLRALERDRDARYGSAREFLEALRPFGAGGIAVADDPPARVDDDGPGPAGWLERRPARRRGARRWRVAAAALAALALVMVALAAGYSRLAR